MSGFELYKGADHRFFRDPVVNAKLSGTAGFTIVDHSFMETLGALVYDRNVTLCCTRFRKYDIAWTESEIGGTDSVDALSFIQVTDENIDQIATPPGFSELVDFELYIKRKTHTTVKLYSNQDRHYAIIASQTSNSKNLTLIHLLQAAIPRLLPWLFKDKPLTKTEKNLLLADNSEEYIKCIDALYEEKNVKENFIRVSLANLKGRVVDTRIAGVENNIHDIENDITDLIRRYEELCRERDSLQTTLYGLKWRKDNEDTDESEIATLFINSKQLTLLSVSDEGEFDFLVKTTLNNFDPDMFNKNNSYYDIVSRNDDPFWTKERRLFFMSALFCDEPAAKVKIAARFALSVNASIRVGTVMADTRCCDCVPNAHLEYHSCLGGNEMYIRGALREGNWVSAVTQCISATGSQNLMEECTFRKLARDIFNSDNKIILLANGESVTTKQAYEWLWQNGYIKGAKEYEQTLLHDQQNEG